MRVINIIKGKKFQVNIDDTFTGDSIIIDCHTWNEKPLTKKEYLNIDKVKDIIGSSKPLYLLSEE